MKACTVDSQQPGFLNRGTEALYLGEYHVLVLIPAYNEARFIGSIVLNLKQYPVDVVLINDGSTDSTSQIAQLAGAIVYDLPENRGKGAALEFGFNIARQLQPDAVVVIDADGQHLASEMPILLEPILTQHADICVGSRYLNERSNIPVYRRWGHKLINLATSIPSGVSISDSQCGFRAFSPRAINSLQFMSVDFTVESEMQFLAKEYNLKISEVPVTVLYQDQAKRSALKQGMIVLNGILRLVGQYRPLLFFTLPGWAFLLSGIAFGLFVVQEFVTGSALFTLLLSMAGMILLSTGFTLHAMRAWLLQFFEKEHKK